MRTVLFLLAIGALAQSNDPFLNNSLPNPYRTLRGWAELPAGMTWPAITGALEGPDGNLYVLGRCNENSCAGRKEPAVLVYNAAGKIVNSWGSGLFNFPHGFAFDKDGNLWISDATPDGGKGNQVFKFTRDGKLLMTLGKAGAKGAGTDVFDQPTSIAIAPNGDIFVSEGHAPSYGNSRIVKFSKDGKQIKVIGKKGRMPGEFMGPHGLAFDSQGRLFVADRGNNRIQILDQEGRFLAEWRQFGRSTSPTPNPGAPTNPAGKKASASAAPNPARSQRSSKTWNPPPKTTAEPKPSASTPRATSTAAWCAGRCWKNTFRTNR
jgi:hypothetical protein